MASEPNGVYITNEQQRVDKASKIKKTFKRETAWAFLAIMGYVVLKENVELLQVLIWPFMLFITSAYGMDWASKQTDLMKGKGL